MFLASIVAPGRGPPSTSLTVPDIRLVVTSVCASAGIASAKARKAIQIGSSRHRANRGLHIELLLIRISKGGRQVTFRHCRIVGRNLHETAARLERSLGFFLASKCILLNRKVPRWREIEGPTSRFDPVSVLACSGRRW